MAACHTLSVQAQWQGDKRACGNVCPSPSPSFQVLPAFCCRACPLSHCHACQVCVEVHSHSIPPQIKVSSSSGVHAKCQKFSFFSSIHQFEKMRRKRQRKKLSETVSPTAFQQKPAQPANPHQPLPPIPPPSSLQGQNAETYRQMMKRWRKRGECEISFCVL